MGEPLRLFSRREDGLMVENWRPRPESNRGTRICSPLRNHSATRPWAALIVEGRGNYNVLRLADGQTPSIWLSASYD